MLGHLLDGKYRIERLISRGSRASVYSARLQSGDRLAVKVLELSPALSPVALKRFRLEATSAASIRHPNVVEIHDFAILPDLAYLAMELIEGPTLSKVISTWGALTIERAIRIFEQICSAVTAIHKRNIIHRDLKPSNIIFKHPDCLGDLIKVVDFGIARMIHRPRGEERLTASGIGIGSADYMSPEQCMGREVDERSDIYSLGVLLYQILTGRVPFYNPIISATLVDHAVGAPKPPSRINPEIPQQIDQVILKALEKDPENRYRSAVEMATEFELACRRTALEKSGARQEISVKRLRYSFNRFIGREQELRRLQECFESAGKGLGKALFIIGDPGIGKTELVNQFQRQVGSRARFLAGKFYESGNEGSYRPYLDCLYSLTQSQIRSESRQGCPEELTARIKLRLDEIERLSDAGASKAPYSEEQIKYLTFELLAGIFVSLSNSMPLVLFLDDLQWADSLSLEFLAYMLRNSEESRILVLCTVRGQDLADESPTRTWMRRMSGYGGYNQIRLSPLSDTEIRTLVDSIFGDIRITEAVIGRICQVSEGNPFYLGEILRQLIQEKKIVWAGERWHCADLENIDLPDSVLDLVELHLNRLTERDTNIFSLAAVVGERFSLQLLHAITDLSMSELMDTVDTGLREFIIKESEGFEPGADDNFVFYHSTLHKVLYGRLSSERRRSLHAGIADRLEKIHQHKLDRVASELAYHFYCGGEHHKTLLYSVQSGETAQKIFAIDEALKYYTWAAESFEKLKKAGEDLSERADWLAHFRLAYGSVLMHLGKNESAHKQFELGLELSGKGGSVLLRSKILRALGELSWSCGNYRDAIGYCEEGLNYLKEAGDAGTECRLLGVIGDTYFSQGLFDQALDYCNRSLLLARRTGDRASEAEALRRIGSIMGCHGRAKSALEHLEEALDIARSIGNRQSEWLIMMVIGNIYLEEGRLAGATEYYNQARSIARSIGRRRGECRIEVNLGEVCRRQGDLEGAKNYYNSARTIAAEIQDHEIEGHSLSNLGLVYEDLGEIDPALDCFHQALEIFSETNYHSNVEVEALSGIARILHRQNRIEDARSYFEMAVESGLKLGLWQLVAEAVKNIGSLDQSI
jgi:tetratricopeptide (TPR) repeat protein